METDDITEKIEEKKILEQIVKLSENFLQSSGSEINYQKFADDILYISGAKYAGFNLYNEEGNKLKTVAFSAPEEKIKKAYSLLGFKFLGREWDHDPVRAEKIKSSTITRFSSLGELAGGFAYKPIVSLLEKTFNFGEVVLVKIQKENKMIGDFTLFMPGNVNFKNDNYVEIYSRQVGLLIVRSRSEAKLMEREVELRNVFAAVSDPLFLFDQKTGAILDVNDSACSLYGYSRNEMLNLKASDMSAEPETTRKSMKNFTTFVPVRYHKKKNGTIFTVEITASLFELNNRGVITASMRDITERTKVEEELRESEEKYRTLFSTSGEGILIADTETRDIRYVNPSICKMLGYSEKELETMNIADIHPKKDLGSVLAVFQDLTHGIYPLASNVPCLSKDGTIFYSDITNTNIIIDGKKCGAGFFHDVTERKRAEEALKESRITAERYLNVAAEIILSLDTQGCISLINDSGCLLLGYNRDELIGKNWFETCLQNEMISGVSNIFKKLMDEDIENVTNYENGVKTKSGEIKIILWHNTLLKDLDGNIIGTISSGEDITERKNTENKIIHIGFHDYLTGLYNRRFIEEEIKRLNTRRQLPLSFVMGDLNSLKLINDTFGHDDGDKILKEIAILLKRMCRSDDILARWGGDEFLILLPKTSMSSAEEIVARIKKECSKLTIQNIPLGLAIGISSKIEEEQDIEKIIMEAESNMYKNKLVEKESGASSIIFALEQTLYEKSSETLEHTLRIKDNAIKLGKSVRLHSNQLDELSLLASLHDIGKVAIPETILLKNGKPTEEEWEAIRRHPEIGFSIAQSSPQIVHIAKFIVACHENWDGSGYPMGLAKESIPLLSRIMLIVDAFDVMTNKRSYKKAASKEDAIRELKRCAGTQFDPELVKKFIEIISKNPY